MLYGVMLNVRRRVKCSKLPEFAGKLGKFGLKMTAGEWHTSRAMCCVCEMCLLVFLFMCCVPCVMCHRQHKVFQFWKTADVFGVCGLEMTPGKRSTRCAMWCSCIVSASVFCFPVCAPRLLTLVRFRSCSSYVSSRRKFTKVSQVLHHH